MARNGGRSHERQADGGNRCQFAYRLCGEHGKTKATLRAPMTPPACKKSDKGQHQWSTHSTIPFCIWCGKMREESDSR